MSQFMWRGQSFHIAARDLALLGADGRAWYSEAGASIGRYAARQGVSRRYVCDVCAILSPRVSVAFNVRLTRAYIETGRATGCMTARAKALEVYEQTGRFNGPKVNAFANALEGDPNAVVVDAWMFRALGDARSPTDRHYQDVADKVRTVAGSLDWPPAETQAAIWTGIRRAVGFKLDGRVSFE